MNARTDAPSAEKRLLLAQVSLNRLHLIARRDGVRLALGLGVGVTPSPAAPAWHRIAFVVALASAGRERTARALSLARRVLTASRVVRVAIACARAVGRPPACGTEQTARAPSAILKIPTRRIP